jgi:2-oxoglutarate ferredoxin oxidoreductase subunit beta
VDVDIQHLTMVLERAAHHKGVAFVEVYQDCNVFNSGAFDFAAKKDQKADNCIYLEHGKPLIYGANRDKGIRLTGDGLPQVVSLNEVKEDDLIFHDEKADDPSLAFLLGRMRWPHLPEPMGVFRSAAADVRRRGCPADRRSHGQERSRRRRQAVQQRRHVGSEVTRVEG